MNGLLYMDPGGLPRRGTGGRLAISVALAAFLGILCPERTEAYSKTFTLEGKIANYFCTDLTPPLNCVDPGEVTETGTFTVHLSLSSLRHPPPADVRREIDPNGLGEKVSWIKRDRYKKGQRGLAWFSIGLNGGSFSISAFEEIDPPPDWYPDEMVDPSSLESEALAMTLVCGFLSDRCLGDVWTQIQTEPDTDPLVILLSYNGPLDVFGEYQELGLSATVSSASRFERFVEDVMRHAYVIHVKEGDRGFMMEPESKSVLVPQSGDLYEDVLDPPAGGRGSAIFESGFESGTACAWAAAPCDLDGLLSRLAAATSAGDLEAAVLASLESVLGPVPQEVREAANAFAQVAEDFPELKGEFLDLAKAHELATAPLDSSPTLEEALARLGPRVANAYTFPQQPTSAELILMFSAAPGAPPPLPLAPDSRLTFAGSILYASWLAEEFSLEKRLLPAKFSACELRVNLSTGFAIGQILVRNVAVAAYRAFQALVNAGEAILTCSSLGVAEAAGVILDAVQSCVGSRLASWVEVEAEEDCMGQPSGPSSPASCVAGMVPCLGDLASVINNSAGVESSIDNMVNGICTVVRQREILLQACDEATCPPCYELQTTGTCGIANFASCFDPTRSPNVSCVLVDPTCVEPGTPVITKIVGSNLVPDGETVLNEVHFLDADAGIDRFSSDPVADTCGGCATPSAWNPGVQDKKSGTFLIGLRCECNGHPDFRGNGGRGPAAVMPDAGSESLTSRSRRASPGERRAPCRSRRRRASPRGRRRNRDRRR